MLPVKGFVMIEAVIALALTAIILQWSFNHAKNITLQSINLRNKYIVQLALQDELAYARASNTTTNRTTTYGNTTISVRYHTTAHNTILTVSTADASESVFFTQ